MHPLFCRSFSVMVKDLAGKNHQMSILNMLYPVDEKDSYKKVNEAYSYFKGIDCVFILKVAKFLDSSVKNWKQEIGCMN